MISRIKNIIKENTFNPKFIWLFTNSCYFSRKNLFKYFEQNSSYFGWFLLDFGAWESPYKELIKCDKYITLDIEQSWHDNTKNDINYFYDWKKIPFDDNTFDTIISTQVFEHISNLDEIIIELYRVLKKGWKAYFTVPFSWEEHEIPFDFYRFTHYWIKIFLEKAWFKTISIQKSWNYIQVIFQYIICYLLSLFSNFKNNYLKILFIPIKIIIIFVFNILALLLSLILPNNNKVYFDNIILVTK